MCTVVVMMIFHLFGFCLGIAEAVFVAQYSDFNDGCSHVWEWMIAACVFNICIPVFTCCGGKRLTEEEKERSDTTIQDLLPIGNLIVGIWSMVTYYNISSECQQFWETNAPELWTLVMIHYVMMWVMIGIVCLMVLLCMCACFAQCCSLSSLFLKNDESNVDDVDENEVIKTFTSSIDRARENGRIGRADNKQMFDVMSRKIDSDSIV